jgi:two-component system NtrC family sensor kinase
MPDRAHVASLEAIENFRAKLIIYRDKAGRVLDEVDVHAALDESLHLIRHQVELQGLKLDADLDGHPIVRADFGQLRQAFVNILLNAVEASSRGDTVRISSVTPTSGEVVVSVADTGVGIDDENLQHILDPFFTTKEKGTGLGLSVVYGIVESLGGRFEVESLKGRGTTVRIRLPQVAGPVA